MANNVWVGAIMSLLFIIPMFYLMVQQGTIVINRPYHTEYQQCVNDMQTIKTNCPDVKCNCGAGGIFFTVVGGMLGLTGYGVYLYSIRHSK